MESEGSKGNSSNDSKSSTPAKPAMKKFLYKSPLSMVRTVNKPTTDSSFKPMGVSSPKPVNNGTGDRYAIDVPAPPVFKNSETTEEQARTPPHGNSVQGFFNSPIGHSSLAGQGGHWRTPSNDMTPNNKRNKGNRPGFPSSTPDERGGPRNSPQHSGGFRGNDQSFGQNSFQPRHNNRGRNSFGNQQTPYSPQSRFNSSERSHNSPFNGGKGNRGGRHNKRMGVDISRFYHPSMTSDPWAELISQKMSESSLQFISPIKSPYMNVSNMTNESESPLQKVV